MNNQLRSQTADALKLKGRCANFAKQWSEEFGLSEQQLVSVGLESLQEEAPRDQLVEALTQAVAQEVSKGLNGFFDLDASTPHMMNFKLDGQTFVISVRKFIALLSATQLAKDAS